MRNCKLSCILLAVTILWGCSSQKNISKKGDATTSSKLAEYAHSYLGTPYRYGGITPDGFDCSGLCYYIYSHFDIDLPRSSSEQANVGTKVKKSELKSGDLVFFKGSNLRFNSIEHVGIVTLVEDERFYFIHSSTSEGVTISSINQAYYNARYLQARRVL